MPFDFALIPGLTTQNDLVAPADEDDLIARITALDLTPFRFRGFAGKRLTASFGWAYDFERGRIAPTDPIPIIRVDAPDYKARADSKLKSRKIWL